MQNPDQTFSSHVDLLHANHQNYPCVRKLHIISNISLDIDPFRNSLRQTSQHLDKRYDKSWNSGNLIGAVPKSNRTTTNQCTFRKGSFQGYLKYKKIACAIYNYRYFYIYKLVGALTELYSIDVYILYFNLNETNNCARQMFSQICWQCHLS